MLRGRLGGDLQQDRCHVMVYDYKQNKHIRIS